MLLTLNANGSCENSAVIGELGSTTVNLAVELKSSHRIQHLQLPSTAEASPGSHESHQKTRERKVRRREKTSAYRQIKHLEAELVKAKQDAEKYNGSSG